ncbi:MAG: queuine tRNA-ribosyltransferase family protein [Myxococcales bacterium]|nr:queuine tRNA-ribosyltransferase family protein [Myxococcales bacterium]
MSRSTITTSHGVVQLPAFLPDATRGTIRSVPTHLLADAGVDVLMCNALHLGERPGAETVRALGGLHRFVGWDGPIATDSGGFQVWSLARDRGGEGTVTERGFVLPAAAGRKRQIFTPDKAMANQLKLGGDIVFCLDQCTHPGDPLEVQEASVRRTLKWARRCREIVDQRPPERRPLLFAVVQGGAERHLRERCVEGLLEIGFDGFGFGGVPIDPDAESGLVDQVHLVAELLPDDVPLHALGVGRPNTVLAAWRAGWRTFDSVAPTREARRGLLYAPTVDVDAPEVVASAVTVSRYLDATSERHWRDDRPVDETCRCPLCRRYGRGYLAHLFRVEDPAAAVLATLHNLAFLARLMRTLRAVEGRDVA